MHTTLWLNLSRLLIGTVTAVNLQCAFVFVYRPEIYAPGFELSGIAGAAAVRGMGILFFMWNIPYLVALLHPLRHQRSLWEALTMQAIGVLGEGLLWAGLPESHTILAASIGRFLGFDAAGLALLVGAAAFAYRAANQKYKRSLSPQ